jgi:Zn-dependent peptidase ImmA (M78 family)
MKIPKKVKIGWREFQINENEGKRDDNGSLLDGQISYEERTIYLNKDYGIEQEKVSLLHEIMHGIFNKQGHSEWRTDENLVDAIAEGLYELINDNPELFKEDK